MAAQMEEVIGGADSLYPEHVCPYLRNHLLDHIPGRHEIRTFASSFVQCRQDAPIQLSTWI